MRTVITGGAGFIGSHLTEALLDRGDRVVCVERPGASRGWLEGREVDWRPVGLEDPVLLEDAIRGADVVFHLAGLTEARHSQDFYAVNTEGTAHVLRAASHLDAAPPHVILLSSLAAVGPCRNGERLGPDSVPRPLTHYGNSKLLAEAVVHAYGDRVPTTVVRLPSVYGPREKAVLTLFRMIRHGVALTVGGWEREVSLIHVHDVVAGLVAAAGREVDGTRTYCLAHPEVLTWADFAGRVGEAVGRRPRLLSLPVACARLVAVAAETVAALRGRPAVLNRERVRELSQERWVCDPSRAVGELEFSPSVPAARGARETADWYRRMAWI